MKKQLKKLNLTRETLHLLATRDLGRGVAGGTDETEMPATDGAYTCHSCASTPYQTCTVYN